MENSCKWQRSTVVVTSIVFAVLAIVVYNLQWTVNSATVDQVSHIAEPKRNNTAPKKPKKSLPIESQLPRCSRVHLFIIIIQELQQKKTTCLQFDCHDENSEKDQDQSRGLFIVYIAVAVLLISLAFELVELYRVRKNPPWSGSKPKLSRRCSLADLTVLRHNRRESMMRRDSVMHMSFDSSNHRVPLKLLGRTQSRPRLRVD